MANATILGQLGLFVRPHFLSPESCRQIRAEMAAAARAPAMVRPAGQTGGIIDDTTRRTGIASISPATNALIEDKLRAIQPEVAEYFRIRVDAWQRLQFYIYEAGDFFAAHRDKDAVDPVAPDWVKARQVSVSILLNDDTVRADGERYGGGSLVFYGYRGDGRGGFSVPLQGEEGMFIAFPSDWIHEVKPVTSGRRYTIVTWLV